MGSHQYPLENHLTYSTYQNNTDSQVQDFVDPLCHILTSSFLNHQSAYLPLRCTKTV